MILDTSAVAAIFLEEPEAVRFAQLISSAERCLISVGTFLELSMVLERRIGPLGLQQCEMLFRRTGTVIEPFTVEQAYLARQAFHEFGKGRHPAGLNFGDCFAYALSKATREPLLFKGNDSRKTDVTAAD